MYCFLLARAARLLTSLVVAALLLLALPTRAHAYPWMIRHEYGGCATCHTDPSGAGVLTAYGRAQSELLLSTRYHAPAEDEEPSRASAFLFGVAPTPEWLLLQGWVRNGAIWNDVGGTLVDHRLLQMRADVGAHVALGAFRAAVTLGYNDADAASQAHGAWLTRASGAGNLVSREHWAGAALADDTVLLRLGRLNLPFGLRNIEHTSWVRSETRTDFNQSQQHGAALAYSSDGLRAEAMAIAGNYQLSPDAYRERGYSAYAEIAPLSRLALGVSSLIVHAASDPGSHLATTRQAHGAFARAAPVRAVALLGELDGLVTSASGRGARAGYVGFLQVDVEPVQGVHAIATGEALDRGGDGEVTHLGSWLGAAWFPVPHLDVRADAIRRTAAGSPAELTFLVQLHLYL